MRSTGIFIAGAVTGAAALALIGNVLQRSGPTETAALAPAETSPVQGLQPRSQEEDAPARACPEPVQQGEASPEAKDIHPALLAELCRQSSVPEREPERDAQWDALVGGMLEQQLAYRTGRTLAAQKKDRLLAELARLREASMALQQAPAAPDDPAGLRDQLTQTLALVEVDQAFRRELGVGVAEFLQDIDPGAVEEVSPAPTEP